MITTIYFIVQGMLAIIVSLSIVFLPPKYYTKWENRKNIFIKDKNLTRNCFVWYTFIFILNIIISLNFF